MGSLNCCTKNRNDHKVKDDEKIDYTEHGYTAYSNE